MREEIACGRVFQVADGDRERLEKHRAESIITCPETCWCWDVAKKLARDEMNNDPGDTPATTDPYLQLYWTEGVHRLVELLHSRDREIEAWKGIYDEAVTLGEKHQEDYWEVRKELEELKNDFKRLQNEALDVMFDKAVEIDELKARLAEKEENSK